MKVFERIYVDFFMPQRFDEYTNILEYAINKGYHFTSVIDYYENYYNKKTDTKVIILRHDIDSDLRGTKKFFQIEKELNVKATYYFRLNTIDYNLMNEIMEYGSEIGYHYEELATYCKKYKIKNKKDLNDEHLKEIYDMFIYNMNKYFKDYKIKTIASHGDFYNRELGVANHYIFEHFNYNTLGIEIETYDKELLNSFDIYISDARYKPYWKNNISIYEAIEQNKNNILFLSHPGNWESNVSDNIKDNFSRLFRK